MPKKRGNRKGGGRSGGGAGSDAALRQLIASHPGAGNALVVKNSEDLRTSPGSWNLVQNPPRNFLRMIHWIQATYKDSIATSGIGAVVEKNQSFAFSSVGDAASYQAVFDQYCVHSAVVRVMSQAQTMAAASTFGRLLTALDFDNVGNLGSEAALQDFSSALVNEVVPGQAVERVVKPCLAPAVWAGGAFSGYGVQRMWVNSSSPGTPHYGIRVMTAGANVATGLDIVITLIIGLRNNV